MQTLSIYESALKQPDCDPMLKLFAAVCNFYLGDFDEAVRLAASAPACSLQYRILFHSAHRLTDEKRLVENHAKLTGRRLSPSDRCLTIYPGNGDNHRLA